MLGGDPENEELLSPYVLASAINEQRDPGYDQSVVGFLLELTESLKGPQSEESIKVTTQLTELIKSLQPAALDRLARDGRRRGEAEAVRGGHVAAPRGGRRARARAGRRQGLEPDDLQLAAPSPRESSRCRRRRGLAHARRSIGRDARSGGQLVDNWDTRRLTRGVSGGA